MKLVIAEKPQLGVVIAQAIGIESKADGYINCSNDHVVTWCIGHVLELVEPHEINPAYETWKIEDLPLKLRPLKLKPKDSTKKQFLTIKKLLSTADSVINAGDFDDEGQLLIKEVLNYCKYTGKVERIIINDLNVPAVKKALRNLQDDRKFDGMYKKALARSHADYLFGMNLTRAYTLSARAKGLSGVYSVGRVQTPILGLIVRRYLDHKNHKDSFYYGIDGNFAFPACKVSCKLNITEDLAGNPEKRILDKAIADSVKTSCEGKPARISTKKVTQEETAAPLPFSLLDLQAHANSKHGFSADKTLKITQSLREKHKAITYNRSDCRYLTSEQLADAPKTLDFIFSAVPSFKSDQININNSSRAFDDSKVTAHTGIIPVPARFNISDMSNDERVVYEAIVKQYLVQFCQPKKFHKCSVEVGCDKYTFSTTATKPISKGWTAILAEEKKDDEDKDSSKANYDDLVKLEDSVPGSCTNIVVSPIKTKPQPIYTEATLLKDLQRISKYVSNPKIKELLIKKDEGRVGENGGIGTPATRSAIIQGLHEKGYFTYEGKKLIPTQKGIDFIKALPEVITKPDITALWFEQQIEIEKGARGVGDFINDLDKFILKEVTNAKQIKLKAADGPTCPECKAGVLVSKSYNGSNFLGCTNYPTCKYTQSLLDNKPLPSCPCCNKSMKINSKAISCNCGLTVWRNVANKPLTDIHLFTLLTKGKTPVIKGFSSKAGKSFDAILILDKQTKKVNMEFAKSKQPTKG